MSSTLTQLRRNTSKVLGPVIHGGKTVLLTNHGQAVARIVPGGKPDLKRAFELLRAIGPVTLPRRK